MLNLTRQPRSDGPARRGTGAPLRPTGGARDPHPARVRLRAGDRGAGPASRSGSTARPVLRRGRAPGRQGAQRRHGTRSALPDHHPHAGPDGGRPGARALLRRSHRGGLRSRRDRVAKRRRRGQAASTATRWQTTHRWRWRPTPAASRCSTPAPTTRTPVPTGTRPIPPMLAPWLAATSSTSAT